MPKKVEPIPRPQLDRPSSERYLTLIATLSDSHDRLKLGHDPRAEAIESIRAILRFVDSDPALQRQPPIAPLANLHAALVDVSRGAKPALLQPPKREKNDKSPTKPSNLYRDEMRALLAGALDLLIRYGGERRSVAAGWLVAECKKQNLFDDDGQNITVAQITKWRDNSVEKKAPVSTLRTYDLLGRLHAEKAAAGRYPTLVEARQRAINIVRTVANHNSHLPPT